MGPNPPVLQKKTSLAKLPEENKDGWLALEQKMNINKKDKETPAQELSQMSCKDSLGGGFQSAMSQQMGRLDLSDLN